MVNTDMFCCHSQFCITNFEVARLRERERERNRVKELLGPHIQRPQQPSRPTPPIHAVSDTEIQLFGTLPSDLCSAPSLDCFKNDSTPTFLTVPLPDRWCFRHCLSVFVNVTVSIADLGFMKGDIS